MSRAIVVKYQGPTDGRGSRLKATCGGPSSISIPYDSTYNDDVNYLRAAQALQKKMGWTGKLIPGAMPDGRSVVFVNAGK
jgi:hypothetical protein